MKEIDPYHLTAGALECGEMHAFQEPHLSLDVPMRENYRPDLPFHANDGVHAGGSDGALRMPPMTFEPMMNMADAVRLEPGSMSTCTYLRVMRVMMSVLTPVLSLLLFLRRCVSLAESWRRPPHGSASSPPRCTTRIGMSTITSCSRDGRWRMPRRPWARRSWSSRPACSARRRWSSRG